MISLTNSGGVALLRRLNELITNQTGVKTFVADDPLFAVARGTGKVLEKIDIYRKVVLSHRK
jgi:rod shape-determining protein MreB